MNDELVLRLAEELLEAVSRGGMRKKAERLIYPLETAMRKGFRAQGDLMARKFRQVGRRFSESASDPFETYDEWLTMTFSEAVPPDEVNMIWAQVQMETVKLFAAPIDAAATKALKYGGTGALAEMGIRASFDLKNPRAVDYLKNYGADRVAKINETTREYLQTLITKATDDGWSYKRTAEAIIERFEGFAVGKPQEHIDSRAHLIAVTEIGQAYEEGNRIVAKDLQDAGLDMEKMWSTVGDAKVSEGCKANEADGWIAFDKAHASGHMGPLRFPGCRCLEIYRMKKEENSVKDTTPRVEKARVGARFKSSDDADLRFDTTASKWKSNLSDKQKDAIFEYTNDGYVAMNEALRTGNYTAVDDEIAQSIRLAREALENSPAIPMDLQVTRGFRYPELYDALQSGSVKAGDVLVDQGFMSTSVMNNIRDQRNQINYDIFIPKGTTGAAYLDGLSGLPEEAEVLFAPGTPMIVKEIKLMDNGGVTVILEIAK